MGITSTLKGYPAETLGGLENGVSPLEMATAYASIASGGYRLRPTAIKKIKFPDGRVEEGKEPAEALPREEGAHLRRRRGRRGDARSSSRTSRAAPARTPQIGCPAAGKTGTTDNNTDAWFVGFTPRLATAVWVGYPKDDIQMNGLYFGAQRRRRHVPGRHLGRLHEPHQGQLLRRLRAAGEAVRRPRRSSASTRSRAAR